MGCHDPHVLADLSAAADPHDAWKQARSARALAWLACRVATAAPDIFSTARALLTAVDLFGGAGDEIQELLQRALVLTEVGLVNPLTPLAVVSSEAHTILSTARRLARPDTKTVLHVLDVTTMLFAGGWKLKAAELAATMCSDVEQVLGERAPELAAHLRSEIPFDRFASAWLVPATDARK